MSGRCGGITREGARCERFAEGPNGLCWLHDPNRSEERRRAASKAGKSKPNRELAGIKERLSDLAEQVLAGAVDKGVAAVASQVLNVYLRAVSVELRLKEVVELEERISALERRAEQGERGRAPWGAGGS
ncbi:MAG: hypothetical protein M3R38_03835, partial [Actinomycetota bacterium]|nr:hypothetical protein [Actinomycetota bacterium]